MNANKLTFLTILAFIVVGIAIQLSTESDSPSTKNTVFFPALLNQINDIDTIHIASSAENLTIQRQADNWLLLEKHSHPVDTAVVQQTLLGLASLNILEPKTQRPENYPQLGLQDITEPDSPARLITLKNGENIIASLILGHDRMAKTGNNLREIYVRKPDDNQSWAVEGNLQLKSNANQWLQTNIVNIIRDDIQQVKIYEQGELLIDFAKNSPEETQFTVNNLPPDSEVNNYFLLDQIAGFLNNLNFEDVSVSDTITNTESSREIIFNTFAGLQLKIQLTLHNELYYAKFIPTATDTALQEEVSALQQKLNPWVYVIPSFKASSLFKTAEDFYRLKADLPKPEDVYLEPTTTE
jgi:hypothetical protein